MENSIDNIKCVVCGKVLKQKDTKGRPRIICKRHPRSQLPAQKRFQRRYYQRITKVGRELARRTLNNPA